MLESQLSTASPQGVPKLKKEISERATAPEVQAAPYELCEGPS